nr:uncharacterized protein DKFZp434B061-like [Gorilla gorilla gorilla]
MNPRGTAACAVSRAAPRPVPAPPALGPTPTTPLPPRESGARARVTPCGAEEAATQRRSAGSRGSPPHPRSRQHLPTRVPAARRLGSSTAPGTGASRASYLTGSWVEAARTHGGAPNALQRNPTQTRAFNRRRHRQGQKRAQQPWARPLLRLCLDAKAEPERASRRVGPKRLPPRSGVRAREGPHPTLAPASTYRLASPPRADSGAAPPPAQEPHAPLTSQEVGWKQRGPTSHRTHSNGTRRRHALSTGGDTGRARNARSGRGRPYVSANPTLGGDRLRQDPEPETGVGDLPDPVTTLVLLHSRLPLAVLEETSGSVTKRRQTS